LEVGRCEIVFPYWLAKIGIMKESAEVMRYSCPDYRPSFRENKPKALVMSHEKQAFWVGFRENWVFKFGQRTLNL
jgi:hypothetical protein